MDDLDSVLRSLTGYRLTRATASVRGVVTETLREFGLRRATFSALSVIVSTPGLNQAQLCEVLSIEKTNMVHVVNELEKARLVTRERSAEDRRAYALFATQQGRQVHERAMKKLRRDDGLFTAGLSKSEVATLAALLRRVETNVEEALHAARREIPAT